MRNQDYYQRRETANLIGLNYGFLPTLQLLHSEGRTAESAIEDCAYLLWNYREARSNFMRDARRAQMEKIYFTL